MISISIQCQDFINLDILSISRALYIHVICQKDNGKTATGLDLLGCSV